MDNPVTLLIIITFVICYFVFGLKGAARFVDNKLSRFFIDPKKKWLKILTIILVAFVFAYIEFARLIIKGILKIVQMIIKGW